MIKKLLLLGAVFIGSALPLAQSHASVYYGYGPGYYYNPGAAIAGALAGAAVIGAYGYRPPPPPVYYAPPAYYPPPYYPYYYGR